MPRKTAECPTCGATLPVTKGEILSCPECGMPIESEDLNELEEETEEEEEEEPEPESE